MILPSRILDLILLFVSFSLSFMLLVYPTLLIYTCVYIYPSLNCFPHLLIQISIEIVL